MYLDFYHLKSAPFPLHPDPTFFFRSASHHAALDALAAGITTRQGLVTITGAKGVGKTTLVRAYLARVAPPQLTTVVLWQARLSFLELLALVARRVAVPGTTDDAEAEGLLTQLQQGLRHEAMQGRTVALIIDEAQDLPLETLEQLPLLARLSPAPESPLQMVLVGQPALLQPRRRRALRRVAPRCGPHATLRPLTEAESLAYIRQRVAKVALPGGPIFTQEALQTIVRHAHGVPHDMNLLCTNALLAGCWAHQQPITADLVQQVLAETRDTKPFLLRRLGLAAIAGLGLVAGLLWIASFTGPHATRRNTATGAYPQREAPSPPSAPVLVAPRLQEPAPATSPPDTVVGHDPDEDHVHLGPQESLERQETPPATLTPPAPAVPPPAATLPPRATPPPPISPRRRSFKSCHELKAEIQAKLDAKHVTGAVLTIIASGDVQGHRIVGSCEGGTKKIALHRSRDAP